MIRAAPGLYPVKEIVPPDTAAAFLVMAGPYGLTEEELEDGQAWFVDRIDNELRPEGYRLAGTFEPESRIAAGVVGFRVIRSNAWGDHLWVEDFITGGIGAEVETMQLLAYLKGDARKLGLTHIHIDLPLNEPPSDEREEGKRGLDAVRSLEDLPRPKFGGFMDRESAVFHGFRELGGRFVLRVQEEEAAAAAGQQDKGRPPVQSRLLLGRDRRRRRGD